MIEWIKANKMILVYSILILTVAYLTPIEKKWTESYSAKHNWPYGAKVTRDLWQDLFSDTKITDSNLPIWNTVPTLDEDHKYLYVLIDKQLSFDSLERNGLFEFVGRGNAAFLSSYRLDDKLTDSLGLFVDYYGGIGSVIKEANKIYKKQDFFVSRDSSYTFMAKESQYVFRDHDTLQSNQVNIAYTEDSTNVNYLRVPYGDGFFYLHTQPILLTNYYLLTDEGKRYHERLTSYLPSYDLIWDNSHKLINGDLKKSPLHVVMQSTWLRWAFWISFVGLLLLFIFRIKRRQRIIPVIESPSNDSVDFVNTIGSLYFNTANNKFVAQKKVKILKEHMSRKLYMSDIVFDQNDADIMYKKTDLSKEFVGTLFSAIVKLDSLGNISNAQLDRLNSMINKAIRN